MVEVLYQLLPIRDWNETFSRDKLCHICVSLDFCHPSLEHPGTNGVRIRRLPRFPSLLTALRKTQEVMDSFGFQYGRAKGRKRTPKNIRFSVTFVQGSVKVWMDN